MLGKFFQRSKDQTYRENKKQNSENGSAAWSGGQGKLVYFM